MIRLTGARQCQAAQQNANVRFAANASAAIGGRLLHQQAGDIAAATQAATVAFNANKVLLTTFGSVPALGSIVAYDASGAATTDDGAAVALGVTISASAPACFPLGIPTLSTTATAQS